MQEVEQEAKNRINKYYSKRPLLTTDRICERLLPLLPL